MSRLSLVASLVLALSSLSTTADARKMSPFAQPPAHTHAADIAPVADEKPVAQYRIAPRPVDRAKVRAALVRARATNLAAFRAYVKKGVFPSNTFRGRRANIWMDAAGNLCAAATLISASGLSDLVVKTGEQNNFIRLRDVRQGQLMDWILTSGFTQDEIDAIQEPFDPVMRAPEPEPREPQLVDAKLRKAEDARLRAKYKSVDKQLVKHEKKSLEAALDRLMKNPWLARQLVQRAS